MQGHDVATELNQLEAFLRQPDAIMEPRILDVLRRYVSDGGTPMTVVEFLSENYVGEPS
jgi:TH1 protein